MLAGGRSWQQICIMLTTQIDEVCIENIPVLRLDLIDMASILAVEGSNNNVNEMEENNINI